MVLPSYYTILVVSSKLHVAMLHARPPSLIPPCFSFWRSWKAFCATKECEVPAVTAHLCRMFCPCWRWPTALIHWPLALSPISSIQNSSYRLRTTMECWQRSLREWTRFVVALYSYRSCAPLVSVRKAFKPMLKASKNALEWYREQQQPSEFFKMTCLLLKRFIVSEIPP